MDEYVMRDLRNYQYIPMMKFVMIVVLYVFYCVTKEDGLL